MSSEWSWKKLSARRTTIFCFDTVADNKNHNQYGCAPPPAVFLSPILAKFDVYMYYAWHVLRRPAFPPLLPLPSTHVFCVCVFPEKQNTPVGRLVAIENPLCMYVRI